MTPAASWILVGALLAVGYVLVFALCRAAGRASRMEERLERHRDPRVHELDSTKLALAMGRADREHERKVIELQAARAARHREVVQRGVQQLVAREVPEPEDAA